MREVIQYIDLPGQKPANATFLGVHNKIILNKHRDVVIQINLLPSTTYKVDATKSEIYNARDKKLIPLGKSITFKDGERLNLWVGKGFTGMLRLRDANDRIMGYYPVADCDPWQCGSGLLDKPAPFMVILGNPKIFANLQSTPINQTGYSYTGAGTTNLGYLGSPDYKSNVLLTMPEVKPEPEVMHIVEIKTPPQAGEVETNRILEFFRKGGDETAVDSQGVLTRNWLWAQIAGAAAYGADNAKWVRELWGKSFTLQKVTHKAGAKYYVVFKGWPALRTYMSAAKYGAANAKVLAITSGAGNGSALRHAAWDAAKGSLKKAGVVAVVFTITLDVAEWHNDHSQYDPKTGKPKKDFNDLFAKVGIDLVKALGSAAIASMVVGGFVTALGVGAVVSIGWVVVGTVVVAIFIGLGFDWLDKEFGITDGMASGLRAISKPLEDKNPSDYKGYTDAMGGVYGGAP